MEILYLILSYPEINQIIILDKCALEWAMGAEGETEKHLLQAIVVTEICICAYFFFKLKVSASRCS